MTGRARCVQRKSPREVRADGTAGDVNSARRQSRSYAGVPKDGVLHGLSSDSIVMTA